MKERWAEMPAVYSVEPRSRLVRVGRNSWEVPFVVLDQAGIDRIRHGYICIACYQRHQEPFPEFCELEFCRFPMRELQAKVFEDFYAGEVDVGPGTTIMEEFEIAADNVARQRHRPGSKIWIPRGIDGP